MQAQLQQIIYARPEKKKQRSDVYLSEKLVALGVMGAELKALLKPLEPPQHYRIEGLRGSLIGVPTMPRYVTLSDSGCKFLSLVGTHQSAVVPTVYFACILFCQYSLVKETIFILNVKNKYDLRNSTLKK